MKSIWVSYIIEGDFGRDEKKDKQIRQIMKGYHEEGSGSGMGERDISFGVPAERVDGCMSALENSGFKAWICEDEDEEE